MGERHLLLLAAKGALLHTTHRFRRRARTLAHAHKRIQPRLRPSHRERPKASAGTSKPKQSRLAFALLSSMPSRLSPVFSSGVLPIYLSRFAGELTMILDDPAGPLSPCAPSSAAS